MGSLKDLSKKKGFIVRITTPYSSYMNGMSERGIQLVTECLRCAFIHSDMPRNLWPELIVAQVHTTNRTATSALSGMTPYEEFCKGIAANQSPGSKEEDPDLYRPDVSHLRVLGSKVWVHIHKERRVVGAKFEPRGEVGVLLGKRYRALGHCQTAQPLKWTQNWTTRTVQSLSRCQRDQLQGSPELPKGAQEGR